MASIPISNRILSITDFELDMNDKVLSKQVLESLLSLTLIIGRQGAMKNIPSFQKKEFR